jgi:hypothetical protein
MRYLTLSRIIVRASRYFLRRHLAGPSQFAQWRISIEAQEMRLRAGGALLRVYIRAFAGVAQ